MSARKLAAFFCLLHWQSALALVYERVAFDSANVCWWGFVPPDLTCPIIKQQNLTEIVNSLIDVYQWDTGDKCEGAYCLSYNKGFGGGRGIAVITTAENIDKVKSVGDLLQSFDISFSHDNDDKKLPYHVDAVEDKGEGVMADQPLSRGDAIMAHTPVLLVHRGFKEDLPVERQRHLLDAAVDSLPGTTRDLLMALMAHVPEKHRISAILTTNAFQLNLGTDGGDSDHHYGTFPEVAKLNHDCRPNAVFYIDSATLMLITTAVRGIAPGEGLTISYLDQLAPFAERQERAHLAWGFDCKCSQCSLPPDKVKESDARLKEIKWIEEKLSDFSSKDVNVGLITYLLRHYEDERLQSRLAGPYTLAALNFNLLGYDKRAAKYAALAAEALRIEQGAGVPDVKAMEALRDHPKGHFTYRGRLKRRGR